MGRSFATPLTACALAALACAHPPRWAASSEPTREEVEILLETGSASSLSPSTLTEREIPQIPVRQNLRPCCAFGSELRASLFGFLPIPGYRIPNVIGAADVGPHTYDSGVLDRTSDSRQSPGYDSERNGLVYTCRGGFIDTAHVRDYVDWSIHLAAQIARHAAEGTEFAMPDEAGSRRVRIQPIPRKILDRFELGRTATRLAQWLAFQVSIWNEIATWYGWRPCRDSPSGPRRSRPRTSTRTCSVPS